MEEDKIKYKKFLQGDNQSLEELMKKYQTNLLFFITRYVKNKEIAEDIYQDVIIYFLENKEKYDFKYSFKTYLYTIAKSRTLNYLKKNKQENCVEIYKNQKEIPEEQWLEEAILTKERQAKIRKVIQKMKPDYQLVIYLTQIEGLSYQETAKIMEKTEKQIKNLAFNSKKKLRTLLISEKVVEIKNNKVIKLLVWILSITIILSGAVYAGYKIYQNYHANMSPSYTSNIQSADTNHIWVGTFQLVWNEFAEKFTDNGRVEFIEGNTPLVEELNQKVFTKKDLSPEDYYMIVEETSPELKEKIKKEVYEKFNIDVTKTLKQMNFKLSPSNTIYTILVKKFSFKHPFQKLKSEPFNNSTEKVKYFGIDKQNNMLAKENVEILFYNSPNEFAIQLNTKENEQIILYKTEQNKTFPEYQQIIEEKNKQYTGKRKMQYGEELKIPYIKVDTQMNYEELCNKELKRKQGGYIMAAIQNLRFSLDETGGSVISEGTMQDITKSEQKENSIKELREFYFDKDFVMFLKEADKEKPYLALKVNDINIMENDIPFKLKYKQRKDLGIEKILEKDDNLKYDVYTFGGNVEITIQNETLPLEEAVRQNKITMENIIHQCILDSDPEYVQNPETECIMQKPQTHYYSDGGSIIYEYPEYSILKRFSLDGNRDIYIGMPGMILTGQEGNMVAYSR